MASSPTPTRNPAGIAYSLVCLVAAAYLVYLGISRDGWWLLALLPAFALAMIAVGGLATDVPKRVRDARGRIIADPPPADEAE